MFRLLTISFAALTLGACGDKKSEETQSKAPTEVVEQKAAPIPVKIDPSKNVAVLETPKEKAVPNADEEDHGTLPTEISKFHDVFAPLWHTKDKKERRKKVCAAADALLEISDAIDEMKVPSGVDTKAFEKAVYDLTAYVADTDRVCGAGGSKFERYLTGAHEALEALIRLSSK